MKLVGESVKLGKNVEIGEGAVINGNVTLSDNVKVGNYCQISGTDDHKTIIKNDITIQDFSTIYPGVKILEKSKIGSYVTLGHPSKTSLSKDKSCGSDRVRDLIIHEPETLLGKESIIRSYSTIYTNVKTGRLTTGHHILIREHTVLGNNCLVGTGAVIDGYCRVGDNTQIHQNCDIGQAAKIGKGVFLGAHTILSDNNKMIRDVKYDLLGPTIEDFVRVGINCMILSNVIVGKYSLIGASSVVTKNISKRSLAYGNPARVVQELKQEEINEYVNSIK